MPKTRKKKVETGPRPIPTEAQLARLNAMQRVGKTFTSIAAEIADSDGKTCSRQLVEQTVRDRYSWPNTRIRNGFARAVGMTPEELGWTEPTEPEK
jgi:hypothetical protein